MYRGVSLPKVGHLLGPTQVATTQGYAHLQDAALRDATNVFGETFKTAGKSKMSHDAGETGIRMPSLSNLQQLGEAQDSRKHSLQPVAVVNG